MNYRHLAWVLSVAIAATASADTKIILPNLERNANGEKDAFVQTTMPGDFKSLDAVVLALLTLSPQAPNKTLSAPFFPDTTGGGKRTEPLYLSYRGLRKKGKTVTLCFTGDAMAYLNSAISLAQAITGAMEKTIMLHAADCKKVEYEVDGEVVTEWDP